MYASGPYHFIIQQYKIHFELDPFLNNRVFNINNRQKTLRYSKLEKWE